MLFPHCEIPSKIWSVIKNIMIMFSESISFKVDNERAREIVSAGSRLCEAHDFAHEECSTWSSGSTLAPIDKDVRMVVFKKQIHKKHDFNFEQPTIMKFSIELTV